MGLNVRRQVFYVERYRAVRAETPAQPGSGPVGGGDGPVTILTGEYGARVLAPLVPDDVRVLPVRNEFFGGNIAVTGLLVGQDIAAAMATRGSARYLLPDVCLSNDTFLDGWKVADLPCPVEVVPTDGVSLRSYV